MTMFRLEQKLIFNGVSSQYSYQFLGIFNGKIRILDSSHNLKWVFENSITIVVTKEK